MNLKLIRKEKTAGWTVGQLFIDGVFVCNTMEDADRGLRQFLNGQYWEAVAFLAVFFALAKVTRTMVVCKTFWLEMTAFASTFLSIMMKGLGV